MATVICFSCRDALGCQLTIQNANQRVFPSSIFPGAIDLLADRPSWRDSCPPSQVEGTQVLWLCSHSVVRKGSLHIPLQPGASGLWLLFYSTNLSTTLLKLSAAPHHTRFLADLAYPALPSGDRGRMFVVTIYYGTYARCHGISHTLFHLLLTPTL